MNSVEKLKREWHIEKNKPLTIDDLSKGSSKNVWWRCEKGHEWQARFSNRVNGTDCPYCTGRKVLTGFNDLATINEEIAAEWHPDKNNGLLPSEVLPHSNITVWWQCVFGHEWKAKINNRTSFGNGCPYCAGKVPIIGETDLGTQWKCQEMCSRETPKI